MEYPFTLYQDQDAKVVQVSGSYDVNWGCVLSEVKAVFYPAGQVRLYQLSNTDEAKAMEFSMNGQEMDAFFNAWETFKAEQELKKLAEAKHVQDTIDSAQRMLAEFPVFIEKDPETNDCWTIRSPELESIKYTAWSPEQLVERVKLAIADYERYKREQAIHDEIKAIKEGCKAIKIYGQHPWHVCIESPDLYGEYASNPEQLLERVKAAAAAYDEWQAAEDRRIAECERLIGEARAVAATCPAITINPRTDRGWCVVMEKPGFLRWVTNPQGLLEVVKLAKEAYEQYLIKIND